MQGGVGTNLDAPTLASFIHRLEELDKERKSVLIDIKDQKGKAKVAGFDVGVLNFILRERRKDPDDVDKFNQELDAYKRALETVEL
jgi:uncharacterized protein (UPF0335 family)